VTIAMTDEISTPADASGPAGQMIRVVGLGKKFEALSDATIEELQIRMRGKW
jgi:hypothetical protein